MAALTVTNGVISATNSNNGDTFTGRIKIKYIRWTNATAADDDVIIKDGSGNVIWRTKAEAADQPQESCALDHRWFNGIETDTIDTGTVDIYLC